MRSLLALLLLAAAPAFATDVLVVSTLNGNGVISGDLTGSLTGNGVLTLHAPPLNAAQVVAGWLGCSSGTPLLSFNGTCVATGGGGSGTVTSVAVASSNGLSGSVTNPTTTPSITLSPTFSGIAFSTGAGLQAAIAANFPTLNQSTSGNAATATALAANPADCSVNQYANTIAANGDLSCAQVAAGQVTGLATVATSGSAADLGAGILPAARLPALTGDATTSAGTAATSVVATHLAAPLPVAQGGFGTSSGVLNGVPYFSGTTTVSTNAAHTWDGSTNTLNLGSLATPATLTTPVGSASAGAALTIATGAGVGTNQLGGAINIIPGRNSNTVNSTGAAVNITAGSSSSGVVSGDVNVTANNIVLNARGFLGPTQLKVAGSGDIIFSTAIGDPIFFFQALGTVAGDFAEIQVIDSASNGTTIGTLTAGSNCQLFYGSVVPTTECSFYDTSAGKAVIYAVGGVPYQFIDVNGNYNVPAPASSFAVGDTNGFEYIQTLAGIPTGVPAQLTGVYANGTAFRYDKTNNRLDVYNSGWQQIQAGKLILSGTTGSIGGGALLAGACASGTVNITGALTTMVATSGPNTYPGDGSTWSAQVTSSNTVTVRVCATVALTPTASTYNVRVVQ